MEPTLQPGRASVQPARAAEASAPVAAPDVDRLDLLQKAREFEASGDVGQAYALYVQVLEVRRSARGPSDPSLAPLLADLARLAHTRGDDVAAAQWLRESRALQSALSGAAYVEQLHELLALARLHRSAGDLERAIELESEVLPGLQRELGFDSPTALDVRVELAELLQQVGRDQEAVPHLAAALSVAEAHGGELHVDTLRPRRSLAQLATAAEDWESALDHWRKLFVTEQALFGPSHPGVGDTRYEMARSFAGLGKTAEAETAYLLALQAYEEQGTGGPPEHHAVIARREVGLLRLEQGKLAPANEALQAALDQSRATLGPAHEETLLCLDAKVALLARAQQFEEARNLAVEAFLATPIDSPERTARKERAVALDPNQQNGQRGKDASNGKRSGPNGATDGAGGGAANGAKRAPRGAGPAAGGAQPAGSGAGAQGKPTNG